MNNVLTYPTNDTVDNIFNLTEKRNEIKVSTP